MYQEKFECFNKQLMKLFVTYFNTRVTLKKTKNKIIQLQLNKYTKFVDLFLKLVFFYDFKHDLLGHVHKYYLNNKIL